MPKSKKENEPRNFEDAMKRLDEIVAELEDDKLPLDEMIARYEEGVTLARACGEKLEAAEQKVRLIARQSDGSIKLEEFDEAEEG
ncbi:MAG: exodeoxyribonuclease VII small subunit [Chthoniobacterales bacterium]|jgi:exodeoxyribonuclease VII small subunit|nr:exodeoxyribonuclease VII small subunit [Chthoniobacterales bacterium]